MVMGCAAVVMVGVEERRVWTAVMMNSDDSDGGDDDDDDDWKGRDGLRGLHMTNLGGLW